MSFFFHFFITVHGNILLEGCSFLFLLLLLLILFLLLVAYDFLECFGIIIVNIFIDSCFQSFHKFLLNLLLNVGGYECLGFSYSISFLSLLFDWDKFFLALKFELSHLNQHLPELGEPLLALVDDERRPIDELLIDLLQSFMIILIKLDFLPQFVGKMGSLSSFHEQVADPLFFLDSGILRISERAGPTIAKPCQVIFVFTEILGLCFHPVRAVLMTDHIPYNLVNNHLQHSIFIIRLFRFNMKHFNYRPTFLILKFGLAQGRFPLIQFHLHLWHLFRRLLLCNYDSVGITCNNLILVIIIFVMNIQDFECATGFRPVFSHLPSTRSMAQKVVMPLGIFYSPFLADPGQLIKGRFPICTKCKAAICQQSRKDRNMGKWMCQFCGADNPYQQGFGNDAVEEGYEGKAGDSGLFFIIDTCVSAEQMTSIKQTLIKSIKKLPQQLFVGLMIFNQNVMIANFEGKEVEYACFNGTENYANANQIFEILGFLGNKGMNTTKAILDRYYVPLKSKRDQLIEALQEIQADSHDVPRQNRQKRATGAALQIAVNTICTLGINTRFVSIIGGPCTIGPGQVVDLPLKNTIRVYMDILEGNENAQFIKTASAFYENLAKTIINNKCTMDMWAYGLDQFGLMEMREMINQSGGLMAMQEQFNHFIFQQSFERFYEPNEAGLLNFPFACSLRIRVSKELKINGILGTCKSTKENTLKTAAEMQIGEGKTNQWYAGGITNTNMLCILISHSELASSENKQKSCSIQAITTYKYSDNILRTRVSTISLDFLREVQIKQMLRGFDQQAAAVMLARMASKKAQVEDFTEVKKWLDRILLKFCVKFAQFRRDQKGSFKLPIPMKHFPQFMYHLRRSGLINPFGSPPDQSIYMKTCLERESLPNCIVMIQSALFKYSVDNVDEEGNIQPIPAQLDFQEMKDDAVLLMDSYFTVIVWYGDHIQGWKEQKLNEDPQYDYLTALFESPMRDASQIIYDRLPISNFYETFKNDGKQRYLKARVNPSTNPNQVESDGHFVTDDAPVNLFMDFLVKSVINYTQ